MAACHDCTRCFCLDDPDAFVEGQRFCRGFSSFRTLPRSRALRASPTAGHVEPFERSGTVFTGDTRPGKDSGVDKQEVSEEANQGHKLFIGEQPRNVIAEGMQRFTTNKVAPPQPDWIRLADNVVSVLGQNPGQGQLNGTNCYIVGTGKKRVLIDAGEFECGDKFLPIFEKVMTEIGCEGLQEILVTHMHHDHFGCISQLQDLYGPGIPVGKFPSRDNTFTTMDNLMKHDIIKYLEDENGEPKWKPTAGVTPMEALDSIPPEEELDWGDKGVEWDPLGRTKRQIIVHYWYQKAVYKFYKQDLGKKYPFHVLADDDVIVTQGATLRVLPTPGHSPDHASFYLKEGNALFSGDHVLGFGTTFVQDMHDYMQSLMKMEALKPTTLYPGHGPCIDDGTDYLRRYIAHRRERIEQVFSALLKNGGTRAVLTAREVADILYTNTPEVRKFQAVQNVVQNLTALVKAGRAHVYEYNDDGALQVYDIATAPFNGPPSDSVWGLRKTKAAKL